MTDYRDWECPRCDWYTRQFLPADPAATYLPDWSVASELVRHLVAVHGARHAER